MKGREYEALVTCTGSVLTRINGSGLAFSAIRLGISKNCRRTIKFVTNFEEAFGQKFASTFPNLDNHELL